MLEEDFQFNSSGQAYAKTPSALPTQRTDSFVFLSKRRKSNGCARQAQSLRILKSTLDLNEI